MAEMGSIFGRRSNGSMVAGGLRPYEPSWRDRIASWMIGDERPSAIKRQFVQGLMGSTGVGTTGMGLADLAPGGQILGAQEAAREGDVQGAAFAMMPVPGAAKVKNFRRALPMDEASRMARAREMGFHTDMPLYHGSATSFEAFAPPSNAGSTTGAAPARQGVWSALDPGVADEFAEMAAAKTHQGQQVYPLLHRAERPGSLTLDGSEMNHEIAATLSSAWDAGHDAVLLKNYTTPAGEKGKNILVVKDPSQLRSPFARFDPAQRNSADLLAGVAGAAIGLPVLTGQFKE